MTIRSLPDADWVASAAAERIVAAIAASQGPFDLVLSGGSTPKKLHVKLAERDDVDWSKVRIWFGDDRYVPLDHPESNYRMAEETLLSKIQPRSVHPMYKGNGQAEDALGYEQELRQELGAKTLDLLLLGMGPDAHTASLFPGEPSLREVNRWVIPSVGHAGVRERITMTFPLLTSAEETLLMIAGADKKDPLKHALRDAYDFERYPIQTILNSSKPVTLLVDAAADPGT